VFAAYQAGTAQAIATGGRYDDIGEHFGHAQPATGFSLDVKKLATQVSAEQPQSDIIGVFWQNDAELQAQVDSLRAQGKTVVYQFAGAEIQTTHTLNKQDGHWQVTETGTQTRG
jgi:ATP phosphoribosyltransferase regulatory subunit